MTKKSTSAQILMGFLIVPLTLLLAVPLSLAAPIIIDHNTADLSQISDAWIDHIQGNINWHYAHTSHGGQLTTGLLRIEDQDPKYSVAIRLRSLPTEAGALNVFDGQEHDSGIDPDEYWKTAAGRQYTQDVLDHNPSINVSMWSWCTQGDTYSQSEMQSYLDYMATFEAANPGVTFVYMTSNAQTSGSGGYNRYLRNQQIRSWVNQSENRVLFDFADLDSWWYNPNSHQWEQAEYDYNGTAVPVQHPQFNGNESGHTTYESCEQKGSAVWWMMAEISGWDGNNEPTPTPIPSSLLLLCSGILGIVGARVGLKKGLI